MRLPNLDSTQPHAEVSQTNDLQEALKQVAATDAGNAATTQHITGGDAVNLHLRKRSKCNDPAKARRNKNRSMLLEGSGRG